MYSKLFVFFSALVCICILIMNRLLSSRKLNTQSPIPNKFISRQERIYHLARNKNVQYQFQRKIDRLESVCSQYKDILNIKQNLGLPKVFSLEPSEKLAICRTAKHGSTTWAKNFMHMYYGKKSFVKGPQVYQRELGKLESMNYTVEEKNNVMETFRNKTHEYLTFFVCRNPISKLLSVYNYMKILK